MSFVTTQLGALMTVAGNFEGVGSAMSAAKGAAAAPTTWAVPAPADEVSAQTATQFPAQVQVYQAVSAQAAAIHEMFVNTLGTSAGSHAATQAADAVATGWASGAAGMTFGMLPPETNPGLMYAGPGSGRMLAAWLPQC